MATYPFKVMGLSGEYRPTSKCGMLVNHALEIAKSLGAEVYFWDLDVKPLPLVGEEGCWENENVKEFQELAMKEKERVSTEVIFLSNRVKRNDENGGGDDDK